MSATRTVQMAYGKGRIPLRLDPALADWQVIEPRYEPPLEDPEAAFSAACAAPVGCAPLNDIIAPQDRVVIATSDGTRPVPNHLLIPWLLEALPVPVEQVTVLVGTGTHRANTPEELAEMFGADVARRVRIVNHDAFDPNQNEDVSGGTRLNREYVRADKRIAVGFIEPHFFAGFSGGPKAVVPGVADIATIQSIHRAELVGHPDSTWGNLDTNPLHTEIRDKVAQCPPDFLINVTLNTDKEITGVYAGDYQKAHRAGCARVRQTAMHPFKRACSLAITSNSGFPLDQNLYQTVKGMSAAARVVEDGGAVLITSACGDGVPDGGHFAEIMGKADTPDGIVEWVRALPAPMLDQWQAQVLAEILCRCCYAEY